MVIVAVVVVWFWDVPVPEPAVGGAEVAESNIGNI